MTTKHPNISKPLSSAGTTPASTTSIEWTGLRMDPLDVLYVGDGRSAAAGLHVQGQLPTPRTFAGAVWTALLEQAGVSMVTLKSRLREHCQDRPLRQNDVRTVLETLNQREIAEVRFRGPWLALAPLDQSAAGPVEPLLPMPATLAGLKPRPGGTLAREFSVALPHRAYRVHRDGRDLAALWHNGSGDIDSKADRRLIRRTGLEKFLRGDTGPRFTDADFIDPEKVFGSENRISVGIHMDRLTSVEAFLFANRMLRLHEVCSPNRDDSAGSSVSPSHRVCLYGEVKLGRLAAPRGPLAFGGRGRHVAVRIVPAVSWPEPAQPPTPAHRPLFLLATPGLLGGWCPSFPSGALLAAAVNKPEPVRAWDILTGRPRPLRWAAPAGSVYFLTDSSASWPGCPDQDDNQLGWGFALKGWWNCEQ